MGVDLAETPRRERSSVDLEILRLLLDEWKFRVKTFWSLTLKFNMLSVILILLPVMYRAWEVDVAAVEAIIPLSVLPVLGAVFSVLICIFSAIEKCRLAQIEKSIRKYIEATPHFSGAFINKKGGIKKDSDVWLPIFVCVLQVILAYIIVYGPSLEWLRILFTRG